MARSFLLCFFSVLMFSTAHAQKNATDIKNAEKFVTYFNKAQTDSLYTLFDNSIKTHMPLSALGTAIQQLKGALGNLVSSEYFETQQGVNSYIAVFEKSGPVLYLNFNGQNKIVGFVTNTDKRETTGSVTIKTTTAILKGTLSVPQSALQVPVVLLIAGSGPTDRDGNSQGVRSNYFLQISDALKSKNIAVLRYDKRGVGQSTTTKPAKDIIFDDMVDDAAAIIKTLKADKRFTRVIVAGHSEGSLIGMLAAQRQKADAFISLSGPGVPADVILKTQLKSAVSPTDMVTATGIIDSIRMGSTIKQKIDPKFNSLFNPALQPYLYSWMKYDPSQVIKSLTIPTLIVQGTTDIQVSADDAQALKRANPKAQLMLINGMSHILKEGPTDKIQNAATYTMPNLPLHPELITAMSTFINNVK